MGLSFLQLGLGWYFWIVSRSLLFTEDICYTTNSTIWIPCWARAPRILFVVRHKHWEGKIPLPPIKRNTCFATQWGLSSQAVCTPFGNSAQIHGDSSWWQPILFWCLDKWDFPRPSLSPVTGRVHRGRLVMSAAELWPYSNEILISHCTAYTNSSKVSFAVLEDCSVEYKKMKLQHCNSWHFLFIFRWTFLMVVS